MRTLLTITILAVAGCSGNATIEAKKAAKAKIAAKGVAPTTPEEKIVAEYVLEKADDPGSVEFAKWGPHWLTNAEHGGKWIRVIHRKKNLAGALELFDFVCILSQENRVVGMSANPYGDDYIKVRKWATGQP